MEMVKRYIKIGAIELLTILFTKTRVQSPVKESSCNHGQRNINSALRLAPNFGASPLMVYFSIRQQEWRRVEDI